MGLFGPGKNAGTSAADATAATRLRTAKAARRGGTAIRQPQKAKPQQVPRGTR
jgi:hypothetical protein